MSAISLHFARLNKPGSSRLFSSDGLFSAGTWLDPGGSAVSKRAWIVLSIPMSSGCLAQGIRISRCAVLRAPHRVFASSVCALLGSRELVGRGDSPPSLCPIKQLPGKFYFIDALLHCPVFCAIKSHLSII